MSDPIDAVQDAIERDQRDLERLMRLVDEATDRSDPGSLEGRPPWWELDVDDARAHELHCQRAQAAALAAIALLLLRRDEEMWDAWRRY